MKYDKDKVDEVALALLSLTAYEDEFCHRAWKNLDWNILDSLYEKGYISNPKSKSKSVIMTEDGLKLSQELFKKHFGMHE
ncbi:MAG: hypothetical protein B6242_11770 [Anaerolineaceae bacterium 4572_78]|nr:MAG: hypothetical protein B6242_11770 [Anaerolineaceae bacterium 4572_78]